MLVYYLTDDSGFFNLPLPDGVNEQISEEASGVNEKQLVPANDFEDLDLDELVMIEHQVKEHSFSLFEQAVLDRMDAIVAGIQVLANPILPEERENASNLTHFKTIVDCNVSFKFKDFEEVTAFNLALASTELSISVAAVYTEELRAYSTILSTSKAIWKSFLEDSLITKMQWKERANDQRPGYGRYVNFVSLFGGSSVIFILYFFY